ncbi:hypothetical protein DL240_04365 [Lujinxingia litoralis]|uniref:Phosphoribosyltransferase domain-containing protein n=1 Tax=Lujinxingia litoralis TaxID=2211119 RepID=A0A328CDH7_9DELT|nr:phosphoribosyltransferase family protein [Lujinxingia litoralis]RAL25451.1 hypothetical protein DL240_04365 [Lujinxingia litoralis]
MPHRLVYLVDQALEHLRQVYAACVPASCAACDEAALTNEAFCAICREDSYLLEAAVCPRCALPLPVSRSPYAAGVASNVTRCPGCQRRPNSPILHTTALWEYEGAVSAALRRIKYREDIISAHALVTGAARALRPTLAAMPPALFVPVPAHPSNLRKRGFHLPSLIALHCARQGPHHCRLFSLKKIRRTRAQASLGMEERRTNLCDAFEARWRPMDVDTVVLVDDVLTTGATLDAAAAALKNAGVEKIQALVLARSLPRQ